MSENNKVWLNVGDRLCRLNFERTPFVPQKWLFFTVIRVTAKRAYLNETDYILRNELGISQFVTPEIDAEHNAFLFRRAMESELDKNPLTDAELKIIYELRLKNKKQ